MISVLFVDDEPMLLAGLRRSLRAYRNEWDMRFADSADNAIALLSEAPSDVVVSDIRMPGRTGVDLLSEIAVRWPRTVRIILSGEADLDTACRSVEVSHQYLSKPTEIESLHRTINRLHRLQTTLNDPVLAQMVGSLKHLPSVPQVYESLLAALEENDSSAELVGAIIMRDVSMSAAVLRLVNSAYFSLPRLITDVGDAARLLGFDLLKTLVLGVGIFRQFEHHDLLDGYLDRICAHSVAVALRAREVAGQLGFDKSTRELAGMAGMLHDIGELVLVNNFPAEMAAVLAGVEAGEASLPVLEKRAFQAGHAEIGAYLLALWGLHDAVVEAAAFHHCPALLGGTGRADVVAAVHVANHLVRDPCSASTENFAPIDRDYLEAVGALPLVDALLAEMPPVH